MPRRRCTRSSRCRASRARIPGRSSAERWVADGGTCCELQQLWVEPSHRRKGIATQLVRAFEAHARSHGCTSFYLETFSFQAPELYRSLGYSVAYEHRVYPHGIVKLIMVRHDR